LPEYCRNGVLFSDLLNHLAGSRDEAIKGLNRNPRNLSSVNGNFEKVFNYLKEFPRFSSRYLWAQKLVIKGN
jgi:hypothetical protein